MFRRILATGLAVALGLGAAEARADDTAIFAKRNAKISELSRDEAECRALASKAHYLGPSGSNVQLQYGLTGAVMLDIAVAGENEKARTQGLDVCMRRKGYARIGLNADEARAMQGLSPGPARDAWIEAFLATDIDARIRRALTPVVPSLPTAADADGRFVVRAIRIDPSSLALAVGPVAAGGDIVGGRATPRRTAIATAEIQEKTGLVTHRHAVGTVFQEYLEPVPWDPSVSDDRTAWCTFLRGERFECIRSTLKGYEVADGYGRAWLVGHADGTNIYTHPWTNPITLEVQPDDRSQSFALHLVASKITDEGIYVLAKAEKDGGTVDVWAAALKFDAGGVAMLPFWDRTLVLTRDDKAVRATFQPRTDGKGWLDER